MTLQPRQTYQQRLMLAPNVTLALEVLRMPTMELRAFLEHQLEDNPFLELEDERDVDTSASPTDPPTTPEPAAGSGLDEDWTSHWAAAGEREEPNRDEDGFAERLTDQRMLTPQSLPEWLRMQLGCQPLPDAERRIGESLIERLDEHGYLESGALEELAAGHGVARERIEAALRLIQRCDPPGVGARDLRECLMLQLEQRGTCETLAYRILRDHFPLFVQRRLEALAKATGTDPAQVAQAFQTLTQLNPKPGRVFSSDLPPSIVPDLVVHHREDHYDVELNDQELPRVSVNRVYYRMLKDARTPTDAKEFLVRKFQNASWLIKAIDERNTTLLSIARCLISLQREFLDQGPQAIKPLTQAQVASLIGRHPSTVSRAIAGKTIDTPCGVFRLEQLFASGVPQTTQTDSISDEQIKSAIRGLIAKEDPAHPLSDAIITERLAQDGVAVARRTIAKYRGALKILPAHLRRHRR